MPASFRVAPSGFYFASPLSGSQQKAHNRAKLFGKSGPIFTIGNIKADVVGVLSVELADLVIVESILGTVQAFAFNFTPRGWHACDGSLLKISDNNALFSLLGTQFGGNGRDTFALPDLRGSVPVGVKHSVGRLTKIAAKGDDVEALELNYCICVQGIFPARED